MRKNDMAEMIARKFGMSGLQATNIINEIFDIIIKTVVKEGRVEFRNFGVFSLKRRKARTARNPKTGVRVNLPSRKVLSFKPGCNVKKRLSKI
ncbi:MAG: HU family DNA-binding protein [Planctomycetota bacterium]|nr:HU family DNA-binding protein [Planctomycetota bacterium]MDI6787543.1 HU family DNA-binding protein [Planctomycetota bacterium]